MDSSADLFWAADVENIGAPALGATGLEPPSAAQGGARASLLAKLNRVATLAVAFVLATAVGVCILAPRHESTPPSAQGKSVWRLANPVNLVMWASGAEKNLDNVQKLIDENLKTRSIDPNLVGQSTANLKQIDLQNLLNPQFQLPPSGNQQEDRNRRVPSPPNAGLNGE